MLQRYLDHMQHKTPHERRQHSMRVAGVFVAVIFIGWVGTFGLSGAGRGGAQVAGGDGSDQSAVAAAAAQGGNQLIVSTTTQY